MSSAHQQQTINCNNMVGNATQNIYNVRTRNIYIETAAEVKIDDAM